MQSKSGNMRKIFALAMAIFALAFSHSADAQLNLFWEEIGPNNMGTHVRAMTVDNNGTVWAGSVGGGLWKSTDSGVSWEQVTGLDDNLAVSCIAADGNNIYVGTGELNFFQPSTSFIPGQAQWRPDSTFTWNAGFFQYSGMVGEGVFVSNDGGSTWSHTNGTWNSSSSIYNNPFTSIQKIVTKDGRTLIATLDGLYYSDDADLGTVTKSTTGAHLSDNPVVDVEFAADNVVIAATKDSLFRSLDNGTNFGSKINDSILPPSFLPGNQVGGSRIEIAVAPSNPSTIYVTGMLSTNLSASGVWRSTDSGVNFSRIAPKESSSFQPIQGNGRYSVVLQVSPTDENTLYFGGEKLYQYTTATGWTEAASHTYIPGFSTNYVPTPILSLAIDPNNPDAIYIGSDAEIVATQDGSQTYNFRTKGFNNGHMQGVDAAPDWRILGSERYHGLLYKANGNPNPAQQQFNDIYSTTRGGIGRFSITNPDYIISQTNDGGLVRSTNGGSSFEIFYGFPLDSVDACLGTDSLIIDRPDDTQAGGDLYDDDTPPVNPWILDEYLAPSVLGDDSLIQNSPAYVYLASANFIWVGTNPFGQLDSVPFWDRITVDITGGNFRKNEYITAIDVSGDADHTIMVGTNFGKLYRINNANDPFGTDACTDVIRLDTGMSLPIGWISDLAFDRSNPENVVITYGGYNQFSSRVFITNNGKTGNLPAWREITSNLPDNLPVYTAAFRPGGSNALVVGTEKGIYGTDSNYENASTTINWSNESGPIGNVPVYDLVFRQYFQSDWASEDYSYGPDHTLFAATMGRGLFTSRTLVSNEQPTIVGTGIDMQLAPNPMMNSGKVVLELPQATKVTMHAFDIQGHHVATISDRTLTGGHHELDFNTTDLPAGVYLIQAAFTNSKGAFFHTERAVVAK